MRILYLYLFLIVLTVGCKNQQVSPYGFWSNKKNQFNPGSVDKVPARYNHPVAFYEGRYIYVKQ